MHEDSFKLCKFQKLKSVTITPKNNLHYYTIIKEDFGLIQKLTVLY